jgi:hypothetical protein
VNAIDHAERRGFRLGWPVVLVGLVHVALHLLTNGRYGMFRDEFYYLACADHLDWGYVDQPPLSIVALWAWRGLFGDSVEAIRVLPALIGGLIVVGGAWLAAELGGGPRARLFAALFVAVSPTLMALTGFYSMNAFDHAFWLAILAVFARLLAGGDRRLWLLLGLCVGLGLQNKISVLFLCVGLAAALPFTPLRRHLAGWQPWAAAGLAALLFAPHLVWQATHGWPTREFVENATGGKIAAFSPLELLKEQILLVGPLNLPVWIAGLLLLLAWRRLAPWRGLALAFLATLVFLMLQRSKPYYLTPAFYGLLAAGAVGLEALLRRRHAAWTVACVTIVAAAGLVIAPMTIPLLPVESFIAYQERLGIRPANAETSDEGALPQHFADRFGWRELTETVAAAWAGLDPAERDSCTIVGGNYGEAGALRYYGREFGLPPAVCQHNSFFLWGPGDPEPEVFLVITRDRERLEQIFTEVVEVARHHARYAMPYESDLPIYRCRGLLRPLQEVWEAGKLYV